MVTQDKRVNNKKRRPSLTDQFTTIFFGPNVLINIVFQVLSKHRPEVEGSSGVIAPLS